MFIRRTLMILVLGVFGAPAASGQDFGGQDFGGAETAVGNPPQMTETHTVERGDTLWDLCSKYLNSPWYWPKIWSYNPQLTNPHWIFPGNEIAFYPSDENLPTQIAAGATIEAEVEEDLDIPGVLGVDELVTTVGSLQVERNAPNSVWSAHVSYLSKQEYDRAGQIMNSTTEAIMLSDYDRTYVKLRTPAQKGDQFAVYRVMREVVHPISAEAVGYAVEIIGGLQIVDTSPTVATGQVARAFRPIERGDLVGRWPEHFGVRVAPTPNATETKGYIVDTAIDVLGPIGEHNLVFVDRGRAHGVQRGNLFEVLDRGDRLTREVEGLPTESVGELMVMDVQDNAATAIVTYALRELAVGDEIEMRRN